MPGTTIGQDVFGQYIPDQTLGNIYGGGRHGAFVLDGVNTYPQFALAANVYTQNTDVFATTITISAGVTVKPSQFWLYCETSLTNAGTIQINGATAATIAAAGTIQGLGNIGASGRNTSGVGANGSAVTNAIGGAGGGGGTGGGANTGGTGGTRTQPTSLHQAVGSLFVRNHHRSLTVVTLTALQCGAGGGAGGFTAGGGTGNSGAGGGGASAIRINTRSLVNTGTISANGGPGGNATASASDISGGGGGGGGGAVIIMTDVLNALGTVQALGGTGGTGAGAGAGAGSAGNAGLVEIITPSSTVYL